MDASEASSVPGAAEAIFVFVTIAASGVVAVTDSLVPKAVCLVSGTESGPMGLGPLLWVLVGA